MRRRAANKEEGGGDRNNSNEGGDYRPRAHPVPHFVSCVQSSGHWLSQVAEVGVVSVVGNLMVAPRPIRPTTANTIMAAP